MGAMAKMTRKKGSKRALASNEPGGAHNALTSDGKMLLIK